MRILRWAAMGLSAGVLGLLLAVWLGPAHAAPRLPEGLEERSLETGGTTRWFLEYRPRGYRKGAPMVMLLHGGGGSMRKIFRARRTGTRRWLDLAEENGFLLLAPNGANRRNGDFTGDRQGWNDLRQGKGAAESVADDVGFLSDLVAWAVRERGADRVRVYVTGASNGGMMTYRMLIERPELFAAGVAFIANLPAQKVARPSRPTPIMIVNGTQDPLMPWDGGQVARRRGLVRSAEATRDFWIEADGADPARVAHVTILDRDPDDTCRISGELYPARPGGASVAFYTMEGAGHVIPSTNRRRMGRLLRRLLGPPCHDADGADMAWAFMARH